MTLLDKIDNGLNVIGILFGVQNIQETLGIIILVLNIVSILFKFGLSIYNKIKNKQIDKIGDDINGAIEELEKIKEDINNGEDD